MISRRLLRVKALLVLYAFYARKDNDLQNAEKELVLSIRKTYDLYHLLLLLFVELVDFAERKMELALSKKMPTYEDLHPNRRFVDNRFIAQLRSNRELLNYAAEYHLSWQAYPHVIKSLFHAVTEWDRYKDYMNAETCDYQSDKDIIEDMAGEIILGSDELLACLEEQCIYWNDDLENVMMMLDRTLKKFNEQSGPDRKLVPLYKNAEDEEFVKRIFRKAILNSEQYKKLIDDNTPNWEIERIAMVDVLVMQLAIAEIVECSEIPVKVSLNEYIEVAKDYCTSKSSTFVNGTLDQIVREMKAKSAFRKSGRGLIDESL